jgi:hypothetical protein
MPQKESTMGRNRWIALAVAALVALVAAAPAQARHKTTAQRVRALEKALKLEHTRRVEAQHTLRLELEFVETTLTCFFAQGVDTAPVTSPLLADPIEALVPSASVDAPDTWFAVLAPECVSTGGPDAARAHHGFFPRR